MKILYISSESSPFAKTGGLGDVGSSLPKKLNELKIKADILIPQFKEVTSDVNYKSALLYSSGYINLNNNSILYKIFTLRLSGVRYYFVDIPMYFNRNEGLYGYKDDYERFAAFSLAAVDFLKKENYDIVHCNDWHTGLIPFLLKENHSSIRSVFNIHHMGYQGDFSIQKYKLLNIPTPNKIVNNRICQKITVNYLRAGIDFSDIITLDSQKYKDEVLYTPLGCGLQERLKLRQDNIHSIRNGIDYSIYNPETDKDILYNYDQHSFVLGKEKNKKYLRGLFNLPENNSPVISMVTRVVDQKGFSILNPIIEELIKKFNIQFILMGSGDKKIESFYNKLQKDYPNHVHTQSFDSQMAKTIYSGSDILLMPSKFEPCGLSQLIAIRYGTIPVVRDTGGLSETIDDTYGFKFKNYNTKECKSAIIESIATFQNKEKWYQLVQTAMIQDFSWDSNILKYIQLYKDILR